MRVPTEPVVRLQLLPDATLGMTEVARCRDFGITVEPARYDRGVASDAVLGAAVAAVYLIAPIRGCAWIDRVASRLARLEITAPWRAGRPGAGARAYRRAAWPT